MAEAGKPRTPQPPPASLRGRRAWVVGASRYVTGSTMFVDGGWTAG